MVTRILSSSGTMTVNLVGGQQGDWAPAVPCWQSPRWYNPTPSEVNEGVVWIWSSYWVTQEESQRASIRLFRKTFDLEGTGKIDSIQMSVAADNDAIVLVNGNIVKQVTGFETLTTFDVDKNFLIAEAENELTVIVINRGGPAHVWPLPSPIRNPGGLIFKLVITTQH
jgi:hypothetical protein